MCGQSTHCSADRHLISGTQACGLMAEGKDAQCVDSVTATALTTRGVQTQILTPTSPPNFFGPVGGGLKWPWGGGVPGTPTYIPQNDPLVTLIILNTYVGFVKQKLPSGGPVPAARFGGEGQG